MSRVVLLGLIALGGACSPEAPPPRTLEPVRGAPIDSAPASAVVTPDAGVEATPESKAVDVVALDSGTSSDDLPEPAEDERADPASPPKGHIAGAHTPSAASAKKRTGPRVVGDTTILSFVDLSFGTYDPLAEMMGQGGTEESEEKEALPDEIRALDGKKVAIDGFMIPMDIEEDMVRSFLLTRFPPGCCFGMLPAMDEWVDVEMVTDEGAEHVAMRIVRVTGQLEVGERFDDYGYLTSVYRMSGERIASQW